MDPRNLLRFCRWFFVAFFLQMVGLTVWHFAQVAGRSYHIARQLEQESDLMIWRWERAVGEPMEQPYPVRQWSGLSPAERKAVEQTAPCAADLRTLWGMEPSGMCFRYARSSAEGCRVLDGLGRRWGWFHACREAMEAPQVYFWALIALPAGVCVWLLLRPSPPDEDDGGGGPPEPWEPAPRWPQRGMRPSMGVFDGHVPTSNATAVRASLIPGSYYDKKRYHNDRDMAMPFGKCH